MNTNERELILGNEVYAIISCALADNFKKSKLEWERIILSR